MASSEIISRIEACKTLEQVFDLFELDYDAAFVTEYRIPLFKRFNGYLMLQKPQDWFAARRVLRTAYCKIQRGRLDPHTRSACRGCTSCLRR
ncbi:nitrogenase-stabilizing/protective protein NifW [Vibrio sp. WXL103]|uniref:nitrogenase-stabilizing/protective protein NifW n=1 Tax=Vibrio sp. WXL103 TaxID=3450710 RepID=UPI003EC4AA62